MDNIILISISIILPLVLVIANKLIDRTDSKQKDKTIEDLKTRLGDIVWERSKAEKEKQFASKVSETTATIAKSQVDNGNEQADLMAEAKKVNTLDDALALARKQVEATKK